jgi:serine/threonine protein kinase
VDGIADYEFVRALGGGTYGQVFLARTPDRLRGDAQITDDVVAVKVMAGEATPETFAMAVRELGAVTLVGSPHLVRLFDGGMQDGVVYYATEYLPGGSLADPQTPVDDAAVLAAVADAAAGLAALHAAGIVHRDVKPGNVLLLPGGGKLADVGLAHLLLPGVTVTGLGSARSIEYIDPAVLAGDTPEPAHDIWSLGVTMHRAFTGAGIYGGELDADDPLAAVRVAVSAPPKIAEGLPADIAAIVRACVGPVPDRPTAADLAQRLGALAAAQASGV